jgi:hypothetical protein
MFKVINYVYRMGRRQAYSEMLSTLETLAVKLPRNREGQLLRQPIEDAITKLKDDLQGGDNVKTNA